jgi:hypothetical protein
MSDWDRDWPAPAKINLFLHVVGRRADGYHQLQTVFRFLDYGDTLRCEPRSDDRIVLAAPLPGVPPETDLVVRAAQALRAATGIGAGVTLHLEKRLPMGGGLGGGSSDAATTLMALNRLWRTGLGSPGGSRQVEWLRHADFDSGMRRFESFLPSQNPENARPFDLRPHGGVSILGSRQVG